jgi:hypothetical protein
MSAIDTQGTFRLLLRGGLRNGLPTWSRAKTVSTFSTELFPVSLAKPYQRFKIPRDFISTGGTVDKTLRKLRNWRLWTGFTIGLAAVVVYFLIYKEIRDVFWFSLALFVVAGVLLFSGMRRAFKQPERYRGKVAGSILVAASLILLAMFGVGSYLVSRSFPTARRAPQVGQAAPAFTLLDTAGKPVSLAQILSTPMTGYSGGAPKGVLVVF